MSDSIFFSNTKMEMPQNNTQNVDPFSYIANGLNQVFNKKYLAQLKAQCLRNELKHLDNFFKETLDHFNLKSFIISMFHYSF